MLKDCYKNIKGRWVKTASMNTERSGFSMTVMGDSIIVAGGINTGWRRTAKQWLMGKDFIFPPPFHKHYPPPLLSVKV